MKSKSPRDEWNATKNYEEDVFSVFADKKAINPIFTYLNKKPHTMVVADLGCGSGNLLPFLSERFEQVIAVDFSEPLLHAAKKKNSNRTNISYKALNLKNLKEIHNTADIIISVNSLFPEKIRDIDIILAQFRNTLKKNGELVAILPSAESLMHSFMLHHQQLLIEGKSENKALQDTFETYNIQKNIALGLFAYNKGENPQKHYFQTELKSRLARNGFELILIDKVEYSWEFCEKNNAGYYPEEQRLWDWFVVAKKVGQ